jgi:hypothetical protein
MNLCQANRRIKLRRVSPKHMLLRVARYAIAAHPLSIVIDELLAQKFQLFEGVFGASDEVLGAIGSGVDFERRIADIYQNCRDPQAIRSSALLTPEVQSAILAEVTERLKPMQGNLLAGVEDGQPKLDLSAVVAKTTEIVVQQTIDIPRIAVVPTGEVTTGFHPFQLDVAQLHLQPGEREIIIHNLHTNEQDTLASEVANTPPTMPRP